MYDDIKSDIGRLATFSFIFSAVFHIWHTQGFTSLFNLNHIAFILGGMFIAALLLGVIYYAIFRLIVKLSPANATVLSYIGLVFAILQIWATYQITVAMFIYLF